MIVIDERRPNEAAAAEALRMRVFGGSHLRKTSQRLRQGRLPAEGLDLVAREGGSLVGVVTLWDVALARTGGRGCCWARSPSAPSCAARGWARS